MLGKHTMKDLNVIDRSLSVQNDGCEDPSRELQSSFSKMLAFRLNNEINMIRRSNCAPTEQARK